MTGRLKEAEENLRNVAHHFSHPLTDQHSPIRHEHERLLIRILNDTGEALLRIGSLARATEAFNDILDSQMDTLGESHPTIVSIKLNLGRAHIKNGRFTAAHCLLKEVIAIYTECWGRCHPDTMRAVEDLALAFMEDGACKKEPECLQIQRYRTQKSFGVKF
jgi:tetratricopeptide (TPR) repeat protein